MDIDPAVEQAWAEKDRSARLRFSRIGCVLALVLIPAGVTLDLFIYPQFFGKFLLLRALGDVAVLVILGLHFSKNGRDNIRILTMAWLIIPQATICYMIYLTEGYASTYYAGLNLAILGMGVLLPVTVWEVAILVSASLALYLVACLSRTEEPINSVLLYNNLYFLVSTGVISATAVYFNRLRRFTEFRLNFELDARHKELAELDRLKSEFFANVSHELRTPLTLILAPVEDLLQKRAAIPAAIASQLDIIYGNAHRLLRLVNDLLEVIRLEESGVKLDRRPLDLTALLKSIVTAVEPLAKSRGITFKQRLPDDPVPIRGDRSALEKVFFNLLSNAFKFTNAGGGVRITAEVEPDQVQVTVQDTGIGISESDLPFVFDRFRQADSSATRKYVGTGLGLALVKELTEKHDGSAKIQSRLGAGTAITVSLPLARAAGELDAEPTDKEIFAQPASAAPWQELAAAPGTDASPVATGDDERATVLVVDDEPDMQRYLVELLAREYRVLKASDGRQGLALAQSQRPNLMVLDLMLPEIDGLEICRRIKESPQTRSTRIVLLTARADETTKLAALENGADDFLTKPFSGIEVQTRLHNLLRSAKLEQDLQLRNEELQTTLDELTQTQNQLLHSEKINALGRLSAGLLHEVNNPLNYALTALEVVKNDRTITGDEELSEIIGDIDEGMQRIRGIVSELRAFAYPSKGEQQTFDAAKAVQGAVQMLVHERRDVAVYNEVDESCCVKGSRNHIVQVLVNLIGNAIKAVQAVAEQRAGEIRIRAEEDNGRIRVSVRDNGTGIPADTLNRVFDPFYTTRDVGEGMGMGLSVCQTIVRNHGGELCVRSEEGAWTEFTFDLPAADELTQTQSKAHRDVRERTA
ncbi:Response regulator receiver:ATP-binding region, ATPase-like:Histidine kinase A, N-terminal [Nitrococcus mobilis Nb-231]|uniref:histidine kinase n=2 Tax=Nitrococcus mobilis TaxID=35797 RepID=A4BSR8_9GAMM|nr:Response regulator receiver:ATP-binding region, ATPase-like:Histidine kinase A, N-terminal [Nitrococcus mobilis Nb-231]